MPPQLIVMIGLGITYSVTGGSSLHNFYTIVCHKNGMGECHSAGLSVWIIVFSAIHLVIIQVSCLSFHLSHAVLSFFLLCAPVHVLACSCASDQLSMHASCIQRACSPELAKVLQLRSHNAKGAVDPLQAPNFNSLSGVSLAAAFMSLSYSTIAFAGSINVGRQPDAVYNLNGYTKADGIFGIFNALGTVAFAYGGHNVILEIQVGFCVCIITAYLNSCTMLCGRWLTCIVFIANPSVYSMCCK